jgi:hypothetical protein
VEPLPLTLRSGGMMLTGENLRTRQKHPLGLHCHVFDYRSQVDLSGMNFCLHSWKSCISLTMRETIILMTYARAGRRRRNARIQEVVLVTAHCNPSADTLHISSATGLLSQRSAWRTVCDNVVSVSCTTSARVVAGDRQFSR